MNYFYLLELIASEVFSSNSMESHSRTAQYLSALATFSQALSRRQQALSNVERYCKLLALTLDEKILADLGTQRRFAERDQGLAELELRGIGHWINTLSGSFVDKEQLSQALSELINDVASDAFAPTFLSDEEINGLVFNG